VRLSAIKYGIQKRLDGMNGHVTTGAFSLQAKEMVDTQHATLAMRKNPWGLKARFAGSMI